MRALSITQPSASKLVGGEIDKVTIGFNTNWRGTLAIYANKKVIAGADPTLPRGTFVGFADLVRTYDVIGPGFGWVFENPIALAEPIPHRGSGDMRKFWYADVSVPEEVKTA